MTAREAIRAEYGKARNFMTPYVIRVGKISRPLAYELSWGHGMLGGNAIYGVSVVRIKPDGTTERCDKPTSQCFGSLAEAEEHIASLKRGS